MTTYHNFDSFNGWVLPGSGRQVSFGFEDCFVDENGDLWVPCTCGEQSAHMICEQVNDQS